MTPPSLHYFWWKGDSELHHLTIVKMGNVQVVRGNTRLGETDSHLRGFQDAPPPPPLPRKLVNTKVTEFLSRNVISAVSRVNSIPIWCHFISIKVFFPILQKPMRKLDNKHPVPLLKHPRKGKLPRHTLLIKWTLENQATRISSFAAPPLPEAHRCEMQYEVKGQWGQRW